MRLALRLTDAAGQPVAAARLSLSVAETSLMALDPDAETVASRLLLTADLAGYVESPGYYFRAPAAEAVCLPSTTCYSPRAAGALCGRKCWPARCPTPLLRRRAGPGPRRARW